MKRMDLFCASPASTAICSSMVDSRSLDRRGHHHNRRRRRPDSRYAPCNSSQLPIIPKPASNYFHEKSRKSSAKQSEHYLRRKSSADITDLTTSPPGSSRYLLSDRPFIDLLSESDHHRHHNTSALIPSSNITTQASNPSHEISNDSPALMSSSSSTKSRDQVVVLRVSIHCKGCEGKVRKHILKMEGVTSCSIDLETKKVTVIGNVTPLGVLASVSRVKSAQLWPSSTSSPSS